MSISSKFRGCLIGGLLGDCLGAPFEGEKAATRSVLNSYFRKLSDPSVRVPYKSYTDDTAMTKCIAQSMIDKKEFNTGDLAKRFVKEFFLEPKRGYGGNIVHVFSALRATKFADVFAPAALQFGGTGSYGNGAAMRIAPVALFCHSEPTATMIDTAKQSALITHANRLGYNGAILQCIAIHEIFRVQEGGFDSSAYLETLISHMKQVEKFSEDEIIDGSGSPEFVYVPALEKIRALLAKGGDVSPGDVEHVLGNGVEAHFSVPTAIYVFLRARDQIEGVEAANPFQRTVHFAISIGGDTDTIATMAGSIAGAYYGEESIPEVLQKHCEGLKEIVHLANELHQLRSSS